MTTGTFGLAVMFVLGILLLFSPHLVLRAMKIESTLNSRFTTKAWSLTACRLTGLLIVVEALRVCYMRLRS